MTVRKRGLRVREMDKIQRASPMYLSGDRLEYLCQALQIRLTKLDSWIFLQLVFEDFVLGEAASGAHLSRSDRTTLLHFARKARELSIAIDALGHHHRALMLGKVHSVSKMPTAADLLELASTADSVAEEARRLRSGQTHGSSEVVFVLGLKHWFDKLNEQMVAKRGRRRTPFNFKNLVKFSFDLLPLECRHLLQSPSAAIQLEKMHRGKEWGWSVSDEAIMRFVGVSPPQLRERNIPGYVSSVRAFIAEHFDQRGWPLNVNHLVADDEDMESRR